MELLLNLLWLAIAVAATTRFAIRSARVCPSRGRRLGATALLCIIALLFPIISVTDDLHEDAALIEETSGPRRVSAVHHPTRCTGHEPLSAVLRGRAALVFGLVSFCLVEVPAGVAYAAPADALAHPRGPPLSRR